MTADSATGGATLTQPRGGFNNSLDAVFSRTIPASSTSLTGVPSAKDPTPNPNSSTPVGAIVGGVLGGVAAILIALGLFLYLRRRKAQRAARPEKAELGPHDSRNMVQEVYSNDRKQSHGLHEVPGDLVQGNGYEQVAGRHEVPGDFGQMNSAQIHAVREVHELGPGHRIVQLP